MAKQQISVCVGDAGILVGTLYFEAEGNRQFSTFRYDPSWLENPRRFALAPTLPLAETPYFAKSDGGHSSPLPYPLADTTPDSWGRNIIRRDKREMGSGTLTELDYLLAVDDFSRLGALRYRNDGKDQPFHSAAPGGKHPIPPIIKLDELGASIQQLEKDDPMTAKALERLRQVGGSLGGARPKCSVIDHDGTLHIAKFTSINDTYPVEKAEVLTLKLARECGLSVPDCRIEQSAGLAVAIIKRFDRIPSGRIPYLSAQAMLGVEDATSGTYVDLADTIRQQSREVAADLDELFSRIGFTILVSNVDDHLRNHGFLYANNNQWRLSPAFDVNPAPERHRELKTHISEYSGSSASIELLIEHAEFFDLSEDDAATKLQAMATTISDRWERLASDAGMSGQEIRIYRPAFEHEEAEHALSLHGRGT